MDRGQRMVQKQGVLIRLLRCPRRGLVNQIEASGGLRDCENARPSSHYRYTPRDLSDLEIEQLLNL